VLRQLKYVFSDASLNYFRFFDEIHRLRGPNLRCISNMCTNDSEIDCSPCSDTSYALCRSLCIAPLSSAEASVGYDYD
jgi:hypothetical protein